MVMDGVKYRPIFSGPFFLQGVKRNVLNRAMIFLKILYQNNFFSWNGGPAKIRLFQSYEDSSYLYKLVKDIKIFCL